MPYFATDALTFHYRDEGAGIPVLLQHGLGADVQQPFGLCTPPSGFRLLSFDCRGHGETRPLGDPARLSFAAFGDDALTLLDHLAIPRAIIGGISLGAALALHVALRAPERVLGLILVRPAWLDAPNPSTVEIYGAIAQLIRQHGAARGREIFTQSAPYAAIVAEAPDAATSLVGQFTQPRAEETVAKLERLPQDRPYQDLSALATITVPTLVLATQQDPIHPFTYGQMLAQIIPTATLREVTPKSRSPARHTADVRASIAELLQGHASAWQEQLMTR